jgi:hypothetical protein
MNLSSAFAALRQRSTIAAMAQRAHSFPKNSERADVAIFRQATKISVFHS